MEDPVNLNFGESVLFNNADQATTDLGETNNNDMDFQSSLLFGGVQPQPESEQVNDLIEVEYGQIQPKKVKLFDGKVINLKPKVRKSINADEIKSSEEMDLIDMDNLFRIAKEKQAFKDNQEQLSEQQTKPKKKFKTSQVWTEKYRPKRFLQLCSAGNDRQYRMISHWLQRWSGVVFNTEYEYNQLNQHQNPHNIQNNVDQLGRPYRKILLVSGPPGIGKTTTVHLIAKQLGYNVEELNAANSMDVLPSTVNTGDNRYGNVNAALKLKIQNALTSNSIQAQGNKIISNGKPTCLVIDEIDTAGNSSDIIRVLNELIQSDQRALNKRGQPSGKKSKDNLLNRPIICIANDAFSTNSRTWGGFNMDKLRSISELISFQKPAFIKRSTGIKTGGKALNSVKEYIKDISEQENLKLEYNEINEIVEICEGDIRACINHLQFNGRKLENYVSSSPKINKDLQLSWFKLTDMLFKRDPQLNKEQDFDNLMEILLSGGGKSINSSSGTLDKVIRGCFNRYLDTVYYQDDSLVKPCELSEWLNFYDIIGTSNEIPQYSNLILLKFWQLFSEINPKKIVKSLLPDIKNIEFESNEMKKQNKALVKKLITNIPISLKVSLGGGFEDNQSMGLFVLPFLYKILFPELASSGSSNSLQVKSKNNLNDFDKLCLEKSASLFKSLQIEFETFKDNETNQLLLEINPNLDSLVFYDNDILTFNPKQIQLKRKWFFPMLQTEFDRITIQSKTVKRSITPETKNQSKKTKISSSVEFFKGQYDGISTQIQKPKEVDETSRIWVKYNEGYSNAVRKTIGWKDLWIS
ncbi:chromosome transmission fidelity protein 18 [[Candida] jaroonii]|uniref:Chromosome transmission fidelity protein 18 n=1 Tax=[Candida] jaroonii TaxID=467808 RepID=A0ACA9Y2K9_9ASCO|nr:chromosome transmission fidelity protein 18 [[Candida] jaroonii]